MSFEIKEKDLLARIGKLKTKSGKVETPLLFPVINPGIQLISPKRLKKDFGFEAIITNAYILRRRFQEEPITKGLHEFLDFKGVIMTDSGAYQLLIYGGVDVSPIEIVRYQERIGSDIATILDIPTGWNVTRDYAEETVKETLRRAQNSLKIRNSEGPLWVGPIQGGRYLDLIAKSAIEMGNLPFQIHALGSPTTVMQNYRFDLLVDMIMVSKMNLPLQRPFHLFGAGHPFMFPLAVALGCDFFDSAAYALYARENRYMTNNGTQRLKELAFFPCSCPNCTNKTPEEVLELPQKDIEMFLAEHNLYVCVAELNRIKQAIKEGRLWELVELSAHRHPTLLTAVKKLRKYENFIEKHSPTVKKKGIFFFSSIGLARPQIVHYRRLLKNRYVPPKKAKILLLLPQTSNKPFHKSNHFKSVKKTLQKLVETATNNVHVCFYAAPFGLIPLELDEVYPLSQHEVALPIDNETIEYVADEVANYIKRTDYESILFLSDLETWGQAVKERCAEECLKKDVKFEALDVKTKESKDFLAPLELILKQNLSEQH